MTDPAEARFDALFRDNFADILSYAVRRCSSRQDAEDVVAETFAIAWRRLPDVPDGHEARLWLFGTARRVRQNHDRGRVRHRRLLLRLREQRAGPSDYFSGQPAVPDDELRGALDALRPADLEILLLDAWEGLSASEIATVLDISTAAVWKRLQRARDRLAARLSLQRISDHPARAHLTTPVITTTEEVTP